MTKNLEKIIHSPIYTMSHPTNSYNSDTMDILKKLGIRIGFRANMEKTKNYSKYEFPRKDHSVLLNEMLS